VSGHWSVTGGTGATPAITATLRPTAGEAARRVLGRLWIDSVPQRLAAGDRDLVPGSPGPFAEWPPPVAELSGRARHLRAGREVPVILVATEMTAAAARALAACSPEWAGNLTVVDTLDPGPVQRLIADPERLSHAVVVMAEPVDEGMSSVVADVLAAGAEDLRFTHAAGGDSALCPAVLLAAALAGGDIAALAAEAAEVLPALAGGEDNPGLVLGALMGGCARVGRDKVVLAAYPPFTGLATWIAPLLVTAGLVPIVQDGGFPVLPGDDRFLIAIGGRPNQDDATVSGSLGAQVVTWEYAAATARYLTGARPAPAAVSETPPTAHPSPDGDGTMEGVEVIDEGALLGGAAELTDAIDALLTAIPQDGCLAIMSYMDPDPGEGQATSTRHLAAALAARTPCAVTLTAPPATAARVVHLMLTGDAGVDVPVQDTGNSLGELRTAQAITAAAALRAAGGRVVRLHLHDRWAGFARLVTAAQGGRG
jgi:glucose-6-phosphate isomerase